MILILNGPNLNLLGKREPDVYGQQSLADLEAQCAVWAKDLGTELKCQQSNHEGQLLDYLHQAEDQGITGIILNAGGFTHTSVALRDAVAGIGLPVVEVHLSNIYAREPFRHNSYLSAVCQGSISGLGLRSYYAAMDYLVHLGKA